MHVKSDEAWRMRSAEATEADSKSAGTARRRKKDEESNMGDVCKRRNVADEKFLLLLLGKRSIRGCGLSKNITKQML